MTSKDLYRVTEGNNVWTFTSTNEAESYQSASASGIEVYAPRICGRTEIKDSSQFLKNTIDVSFPLLDDLAQHFLQSPVDYVAKLELYSKDEDGTFETQWRGKLSNTAPNDDQIKLTFNSIFSSNRTVGARPVFQRNCRHTLYGPGCTLLFELNKVAADVSVIASDGLTLTVPEASAYPIGFFNAGVIQMPDGTMRYISSHSGSTLTLIRISPSLIDAYNAAHPVPVFIAPGCTQGTSWCKQIFNNLLNHGGFPNIPLQNPNGSSIV